MVSIHFSEMFAREMAAKKLGDETDEIGGDEEVREMLGEVGNFVGDNLKSSFTEAGLTCVLSPPSFTTGTDFEIEALDMEIYERFAFKCNGSIVFVELGVKTGELTQEAGQPGNDIHYSVNEGGEEEQVTPANEEVQPETEAGEAVDRLLKPRPHPRSTQPWPKLTPRNHRSRQALPLQHRRRTNLHLKRLNPNPMRSWTSIYYSISLWKLKSSWAVLKYKSRNCSTSHRDQQSN
jgi:hypothetical protein